MTDEPRAMQALVDELTSAKIDWSEATEYGYHDGLVTGKKYAAKELAPTLSAMQREIAKMPHERGCRSINVLQSQRGSCDCAKGRLSALAGEAHE